MAEQVGYVRFQSPVTDSRGRFVGVFALVNALAKQGRLSTEEESGSDAPTTTGTTPPTQNRQR
jgi:hypothetical protein